MASRPQDYFDKVQRAKADRGAFAIPDILTWGIFPLEGDFRVVDVEAPTVPEPPRGGESGRTCRRCSGTPEGVVWQSDRWRLTAARAGGAAFMCMLEPVEHVDVPELSEDMASEYGQLTVLIVRTVESLPNIARCHLNRWGDGGAHAHVFFYARPEGFLQMRGTFLPLWASILPSQDSAVVDSDIKVLVTALVDRFGGAAADS